MREYVDQGRAISHVLVSMRTSIEQFQSLPRGEGRSGRRLLNLLIGKIEQVRINFSSIYRYRNSVPERDWYEALADLHEDLIALESDELFQSIASVTLFRFGSPEPSGPRGAYFRDPRFQNDYSVANILDIIIDDVRSILNDSRQFDLLDQDGPQPDDLDRMRTIVPEQRLGPATFDVQSDRLVVLNLTSQPGVGGEGGAEHAREFLIEQGGKILNELQATNCDRRINEVMSSMHSMLVEKQNIIKIYLLSRSVIEIANSFREELPVAVLALITSQVASISMYAAQFPDWLHFNESASSASITTGDVKKVAEVADALTAQLIAHPELSDPEVPKTLKALRILIENPNDAVKKATFAIIRTIENMVAKIFQYGYSLIDKTVNGTIDGMAKWTSRAAVVGLIALALTSVGRISPVVEKVGDGDWMKPAAEIMKRYVELTE